MDAKKTNKRPELSKSDFIAELPIACHDELAAVELLEQVRWGNEPRCIHCHSANVYQMMDVKTGGRSKRFLWRCRQCRQQYTVRIGMIYEESRLPLRHWCFAFWRASTSKKGVAAMEIQRQCQISYKSALFLLHRIRFAMTPTPGTPEKLSGIIEADETYCGGKPRPGTGPHKRGRGTSKVPVIAVVQRDGQIRRKVVANVSAKNIREHMVEHVDPAARIITDEFAAYKKIGKDFAGGHEFVNHGQKEYARGDVHTNTAESSFAIVKRGLIGIHHAVSAEHLHRYIAHWDFLWNGRRMNDGQRTKLAMESGEGKRLMYRQPIAEPAPKPGEQLPPFES